MIQGEGPLHGSAARPREDRPREDRPMKGCAKRTKNGYQHSSSDYANADQ